MKYEFYYDENLPGYHIDKHNVTEQEAIDVLEDPMEDWNGRNNSRLSLGKTASGRFLKVIYVPKYEEDSIFIITAYDLTAKETKALRKRRKKKQK